MHSEYAVEPSAIGESWETFRFIIEKFGFDKGRIISRLPGKWEQKVIASAKEAGVPDIRMQSIIDRLRRSGKMRVANLQRGYDPELDWLGNARTEHARFPFRALISCTKDPTCPESVIPDECDDDNALIAAPVSRNIPRTPDAIASALFMLALASQELDFVDPYFDLRPAGNYVPPLAALLAKLAATGCPPKTFRIHYRTHASRPPDNIVAQNAPRQTQGVLPAGYALQLHEWEQIPGGEDFHDRFVLTECGGLMVGAGLSAAPAPETATFTRLDDANVQELRARFANGATTYTKIGATVQINSDGTASLI